MIRTGRSSVNAASRLRLRHYRPSTTVETAVLDRFNTVRSNSRKPGTHSGITIIFCFLLHSCPASPISRARIDLLLTLDHDHLLLQRALGYRRADRRGDRSRRVAQHQPSLRLSWLQRAMRTLRPHHQADHGGGAAAPCGLHRMQPGRPPSRMTARRNQARPGQMRLASVVFTAKTAVLAPGAPPMCPLQCPSGERDER